MQSTPPSKETSPALRMLHALKRLAPASIGELAQHLKMTTEAARQQINKLAEQALVQSETQALTGAGRPRQLWTLTPAGQRYFPDAHAQLTVQLIGSIGKLFGQDGLDKLIAEREAEARKRYTEQCTAPSLKKRLQQLADMRTLEGYMAQVQVHEDGLLLIEDHCPICAAASSCQGFCRSEQMLFQEVVEGLATVERVEYLLDGGQRCVYKVRHH